MINLRSNRPFVNDSAKIIELMLTNNGSQPIQREKQKTAIEHFYRLSSNLEAAC